MADVVFRGMRRYRMMVGVLEATPKFRAYGDRLNERPRRRADARNAAARKERRLDK